MRKTLYEVLKERFKAKPATREEIAQLRLDLEREKVKSEIRELKNKSKSTNTISNILRLFTDSAPNRTPRF